MRIVQSVPFSVPFNSRQDKANLTQHIGIQNSRVVIILLVENYMNKCTCLKKMPFSNTAVVLKLGVIYP